MQRGSAMGEGAQTGFDKSHWLNDNLLRCSSNACLVVIGPGF